MADDTPAGAGETNNTETNTENQGNADMEGRARRMGWRPKEEFRGDSGRWVDAKTFIERGETELPILRERNRTLDDRYAGVQTELTNTRAELKELRGNFNEVREVLSEFRDRAAKAEEVAYARARADLEGRMAEATRQADMDGYSRAKADLDVLNRQERDAITQRRTAPEADRRTDTRTDTKTDQQQQQQVDPVIAQWVRDNAWFETDKGMAGFATAKFQELRAERPGLSLREQLDEVRHEVVDRFPEKFENKKRAAAAAVSAPSAPSQPKKGGIPPYEQWPADAKAAYQKWSRQIPNYTKEEYAKVYFAGGE